MSEEGTVGRLPDAGMPLRDGRALRVDGQGVHVGETLYPLAEIQDARIVSPEPATLGLRVASAGLVTLVPVRAEDAGAALDQLYRLRPVLRPAGYGGVAPGQAMTPPLTYLPPTHYGTPPAYAPPPGYPSPLAGGPAGLPPGAQYVPTYGPPPVFPGYPVVPPLGGAPGSPVNEGGIGLWPQGIGEVIGTSFRLYFKRFGRLMALGLIAGVWPALLAGALQVGLLYAEGYNVLQGTLTQQSPFATGAPGATMDLTNVPLVQWLLHPTASQIGPLVGGGLLWLVLTLVLSAWAVGAMALGAREAIAGRPVRIGAALSGGLRRLPAVLGAEVLQGLLGAALLAVVVIPIVVLGLVFARAAVLTSGSPPSTSSGSAVGAVLLTLCGFFVLMALFAVGYAYLMYRVILAQYAAAADHLSPVRAFGRSWSLTWRNWWRTFLPLLVVGVVIAIVAAVGNGVQYFSIIGGSLVAVPILSAIAQPLAAVTALVIYYDLRLRREGYPTLALELGLPALQPPPPPPPAGAPSGPAQPDHPSVG